MGAFTIAFEQFEEATSQKMDLINLGIVLEVGDRLSYRSPVDTGFFRANWNFSVDAPDRTIVDPGGTTENPAPAKSPPDFSERITGRVAYWTNSVPYGPALENGHSSKRPLGFVRVTVMEYQAIVNDVVGRNSTSVGGVQ